MTPELPVAIAGIEGSFSEEAARSRWPQSPLLYAVTSEKVFQAVSDGTAQAGLVPVGNSLGGLVEETLIGMPKHQFQMLEIVPLDVQQNLLVRPGVKAEDLTEIVSHDQALAQCARYLDQQYPKLERRLYADTALAAKDLAGGKLPSTVGVIGSQAAARRNQLEILDADVADAKPNITSFLVIGPAGSPRG